MKVTLYLFIVSVVLVSCKEHSDGIPKNEAHKRVLDHGDFFSTEEEKLLSDKIIAYDIASTNQIAILTIDTLPDGIEILDYGAEVGSKWGVGQKEKDNGLLIVLSKSDREVAISTGYGTEKILTDSICQNIIDGTIIPKFKNNEFYIGIDNALDSIIKKWY